MIWVRRVFAVLLALLLVILLPGLLFIAQVNSTVGNPDFYDDQMEKADIYNFVYDDALPAALDEDSSDNPINTDDIETAIIATARKVAPTEWLRENFELLSQAIVPYLRGSTDEFTFTLELKDKVQAAPGIIKEEMLHGEAFDSIYDDLTSYAAKQVIENLDKLPYSITLSEAHVADSLRKVISKDWLATQIEEAMNSTVPYMTLDSDDFTIIVPVDDLVDSIASVTVDILSRQETYDYLITKVIEPTVKKELQPLVEMPYDIILSQEEVIDGIEHSLPPSWLQSNLEKVFDAITAYAKGESDNTDITIDLIDSKAVILETLVKLGDEKLQSQFQDLPVCSMLTFDTSINNTSKKELPDCRPAGVSYERFKNILEIDLTSEIDTYVMTVIPDQWTYDQDDLMESMGAENSDFLEDARSHVTNGWTFSHIDFKNKFDDPKDKENIEKAREYMENGYTFTQQDIEDEMDTDELDNFNDARSQIDNSRSWLSLLWLIPSLILVAIGFLGGRSWQGRSIWALSALLVASLIVLLSMSMIYSNAIEPEFEEVIELVEYEGLDLVMAEKMNELLSNASSDFFSGIQNQAMWMIILSIIALAGMTGWTMYQRHSKQIKSSEN